MKKGEIEHIEKRRWRIARRAQKTARAAHQPQIFGGYLRLFALVCACLRLFWKHLLRNDQFLKPMPKSFSIGRTRPRWCGDDCRHSRRLRQVYGALAGLGEMRPGTQGGAALCPGLRNNGPSGLRIADGGVQNRDALSGSVAFRRIRADKGPGGKMQVLQGRRGARRYGSVGFRRLRSAPAVGLGSSMAGRWFLAFSLL